MDNRVVDLQKVEVLQHGDVSVLLDVNLTITEGEFTYLVGKTGVGKSSLVKLLYADLPLKKGKASVANYDLATIKHKEIPLLRRNIGMVFQDFNLLYDRDIEANLAFVLQATDWKNKTEIDQRVHEVLEAVNLKEKRKAKPHQLSGGEQQRVAIARALLNKPKLILADEPTGNLDPEVSDEILELLHNIALQGTAVLMATHDYRLINKYPGTVYGIENHTLEKRTMFS